jgi:transcription antitermination factor NusA-like protein
VSFAKAVTVERARPQIKLIGTTKSISMGKMLLELHMKHHGDMARIHSEREVLATRLESRRAMRENGVRVEFPVDKELVGLVVGKGGKNITDTKKATGVELIEVDKNGPKVIIVGATQAMVDAARERLEFVTEHVPVQSEQVGWLIGRGGSNFRELQEKTKVTRLNVDKNTNTVILVGTQTAVAAAQLYIETHLE